MHFHTNVLGKISGSLMSKLKFFFGKNYLYVQCMVQQTIYKKLLHMVLLHTNF